MDGQTKITVVDMWQEESGPMATVYDYRKLWGAKGLMKGHRYAVADFGQFEVSGRYVIHSVWSGDSESGYTDDCGHSEYCDDLIRLREGGCRLED